MESSTLGPQGAQATAELGCLAPAAQAQEEEEETRCFAAVAGLRRLQELGLQPQAGRRKLPRLRHRVEQAQQEDGGRAPQGLGGGHRASEVGGEELPRAHGDQHAAVGLDPEGGPPGDLYVFLSVRADPRFRREGMEIYSEYAVSYVDAILGSTLKVPTVDGVIDLQMPAGTQPGTTLRAEGKGAPKLNNVNVRGSHYVKVKVEIPQKISNKERELVQQLKEATK